MARHPQLNRQQLTDLLDHAFKELESLDKMVTRAMSLIMRDASVPNAAYEISEIQIRIKALIERLSEYK